ncbi:MAG TPA: alkaline phosphatase family protein, partial [Kofleriaceae bacterium]|nr:alkaline phosphatase family protein [Kofleriaceae bacterium]
YQDNDSIISNFSSLPVPSIFNRLHDANVDWAYYYGTIPVLSALNNPGPYQIPDDYLQARVRRFSQFLTDAMAGKLPPVTYIDPAFYQNDDHPPIHPINGQALIATVYTALAKSPHWKNTMLVITYDENGGFFDHVPPPTTADDYTSTGFNQLGFRVPAMIIGPYAKQSYVSSVQYDHTSALKHLTNVFDLPTIQGQLAMRMNAANDLSDTIDMDRLDKDQWAKPVEIPSVDVTQWPMSSACDYNGSRIDPITKWADDNPDKVRGLDLRSELPEYRRTIIEFLREHQGTIGK